MEYFIWLISLNGLGPKLQKRLIDHFENPKRIYNASFEELMKVEGIGRALAENIVNTRGIERSRAYLKDIYKKNIGIVSITDKLYPKDIKKLDSPPLLLYYRGSLKEDTSGVGIVGSRRCSNYGKEVTIEAAIYLANYNIPVISGMAKGIDGYAHTACLKAGGYTIAFLGCGVDVSYPTEHRDLMDAIIENGAVISQYPPGTRPQKAYFPERNILISALSKKLLIAEAGEKSGALITANIAKEQGVEVLVAPHQIGNISGEGNNKLIKDGAKLYLSPDQLKLKSEHKYRDNKEEEKIKSQDNSKRTEELTYTESKIVASIGEKCKTIEEIAEETEIERTALIENISILEIRGIVDVMPGGKIQIVRI